MSGHSKWHTIAKKKGAADSVRASQFTKLAKLITVAARDGGGDPTFNFSLRVAIDQAKRANVPKENIERAIKRGSGLDGAGAIIEIVYEALGPGGSAFLIKSLTDNRNRSISEIRTVVQKNGGTMAGQGSVLWMFEKKGVITITDPSSVEDRDAFELSVIDAGAEDILEEEHFLQLICPPDQLKQVLDVVESMQIQADGAEIEYRAKESVKMSEADQETCQKLLDLLDELEDVDTVYTNIS